MAPPPPKTTAAPEAAARPAGYWSLARQPLHCLAFVAPLLVAFEVGVAIGGTDLAARNLLQRFLTEFGAPATHLSAMLIVVTFLAWQLLARLPWRVEPYVLVGMAAEAMALALPLVGLGVIRGRLIAATALIDGAGAHPLIETMLIRVGGGVYEEFLFRFVAINALGVVLIDALSLPKDFSRIAAVAVTAGLFAWYHFPAGVEIVWPRFAFFFVAGCYQGCVFLLRGFGIAAGAHAFYNIIVLALEIDAAG